MAKIKICGLTREVDINFANKLRPDYVGFVFARSRREVSLQQAERLVSNLDKGIKTVGVFVNEPVEKVQLIAEKLRLNVLQFHGDEDLDYMKMFSSFDCWKSISVKGTQDLKLLEEYPEQTILLDSKVPGELGGTGVAFDWNIIKDLSQKKKIVLAGGLNPSNVSEAIMKVKPYAVDVSSGVESDGVKDLKKIDEFIRKVRKI